MSDNPLNWLDSDLKGKGPRFVMSGEEDGTFTVMDQVTGMPAIWNDRMLFSLTFDEADDLVESMNQLLIAMGRY